MYALKQLRKENESGFTLLELLVVILIIGTLAVIAIPLFTAQRASAVDAATVSDTKTLATAIETEHVKTPYKDMKASDFSTVPLSEGTQWTMTSDESGFCLQVSNPNGDQYKSTTETATYDSTNGGLNKTGGECGITGTASTSSTGNAIGTPGAISFLNADNPGDPAITADGTYSYDATAQAVTYTFDFKNLDPTKTYHALIKTEQNQGDPTKFDAAFTDYAVTAASHTISATVNLKGVNMGGAGPVLSSPTSVIIRRGYTMNTGYGSADIYDPNPLVVK